VLIDGTPGRQLLLAFIVTVPPSIPLFATFISHLRVQDLIALGYLALGHTLIVVIIETSTEEIIETRTEEHYTNYIFYSVFVSSLCCLRCGVLRMINKRMEGECIKCLLY
jgi:hypothetical protein